jgi:hypothetical protein
MLTLHSNRRSARCNDNRIGDVLTQVFDEAPHNSGHVFAVVEHDDAGVLGEPHDRGIDRLVAEVGGDAVFGRLWRDVGQLRERNHFAVLLTPSGLTSFSSRAQSSSRPMSRFASSTHPASRCRP